MKTFKYVRQWEIYEYMKLGWIIREPIYERGGYMCYIAEWICSCDIKLPK